MVDQIVSATEDLIVEMVPNRQLVAGLMGRFSLSRRTVQRYVALAREAIAEDQASARAVKVGVQLRRLARVRRLAIQHVNLPVLLGTERTIAHVEGTFAPIGVEHSGVDGEPVKFVSVFGVMLPGEERPEQGSPEALAKWAQMALSQAGFFGVDLPPEFDRWLSSAARRPLAIEAHATTLGPDGKPEPKS
ncbi:MAG: hypothetical protein Q8S13_04400 [Dehalococcoidia bacterium]|nr:hypothetical protein [Dehalococcoidia bacterium]